MACPRCNGTAIDPEHSGTEYYGDGITRPVPEPCSACQFPDPQPPTPYGCLICGDPQSNHGWQFDPEAGMHQWLRPTQKQIKQRMQARRAARLTAEPPKYHATTAWEADHTGEEGIPFCADCKTDSCPRWARIQTRLDQIRWGIPHRTKHPLTSTGGWGGDEPF